MDARKATIHLDLRTYHDPSQRHVTGLAHAIPILSFEKTRRTFHFPGRTGTRYEYEENESKNASWPIWA